jgi:hypothetical protein
MSEVPSELCNIIYIELLTQNEIKALYELLEEEKKEL